MHDLVTRFGTLFSAPDNFFLFFFCLRIVVQLASEGPMSCKNATLVTRSSLTTNGLTDTEVFDEETK